METLCRVIILAAVATASPFLENYDLNLNKSMYWSRIFNGAEAEPHSIPYQVFFTAFRRRSMHYCGGSLISKKHVLTAAHCLKGANWALLAFGVHDVTNIDEKVLGRSVGWREMIIHPGFSEKLGRNDIAVMYLVFPVPLSDTIKTVNLPRVSEMFRSLHGLEIEASGWGRLIEAKRGPTPRLQSAKLRVLPIKYCQKFYTLPLFSSLICALGKNNENTCSGDSGGPITFRELDGSKTLVGITSFGSIRGCDVNIPSLYTRVSSFLSWIWHVTKIPLRD